MDRHPACIDGSHSCGRHYSYLLGAVVKDIFQESRFAGTCFAGEEYVPVGLIDELCRQLKHFIIGIGSK